MMGCVTHISVGPDPEFVFSAYGSIVVCCSVLQCVAVCRNVLQCGAVCCSVLQCVAVCCSVFTTQIKKTRS